MSHPALFEVSFEVCNKIGGIHTVLTTKVATAQSRWPGEYICIGPWLLSQAERSRNFEEEQGHEVFTESCRQMGIPVKVGRWTIPGRPLTILVEFSGLWEKKDDLLAHLWEEHEVDSLEGGYDYEEPVLFGHAAGLVIERWWEEHLAPLHQRGVAHFHEWMTGTGLLHLRERCPAIGTVFTTHATMLGRALSSLGLSPEDGLAADPAELAKEHHVTAKHSLEGVCARAADAFTTVSSVTGPEAAALHARSPEPLTPNGIDLAVVDEMAGPVGRDEARTRLRRLASSFLGEDVSDAAFLATSGRYEFHNKGMDLCLDAVADLESVAGRRLVLFVLVPARNSGVRPEVRARVDAGTATGGSIGLTTHNLLHPEEDPVHVRCAELGLVNAAGSRVKIVQVPVYLDGADDLIGLPYEAVARAMDLTVFPSYYEPWGYTPQESLALGVPTVTSDYAGFGRWGETEGLDPDSGVTILKRRGRPYADSRADLARTIEDFLERGASAAEAREACRRTASRTSWTDMYSNYESAYARADAAISERLANGAPVRRRPPRPVVLPHAGDGRRPRLTSFEVEATLPPELSGLTELSRNFYWTWDREGRFLFEELASASWEGSGHNPVKLLRRVFREDTDRRAADPSYVAKVERVLERQRARLAAPHTDPELGTSNPVAYFCAEYGIHESLPIYSGGLGILSGDHLKAASDLGLPLIAVGLFYRKGYGGQRLTIDGEQETYEVDNDPRNLALTPVRDASGEPLTVRLQLPSSELVLRAWLAKVGRIDLYLLDADCPENRPEDRDITRRLYGGDSKTRLRQELVLGRGGVRLLDRLGIEPAAWHMNEGHAAFLGLERVSHLVREEGLTFAEAREVVRGSTAFTTHTPVPAGHDRFSHDLLRPYFNDVAGWAGIDWDQFLELGHADGDGDDFNMTYLALSFSGCVNGVSQMHGDVSRGLLASYWPGLFESEVPVVGLTNGVHLPTWTANEIAALVSPGEHPPKGEEFTQNAPKIDLAELWQARRTAKARLVEAAAARMTRSFVERDDSPLLLEKVLGGLDEEALFIGFARRFAPYKRAHLVFQDAQRLCQILGDGDRPVRLLIAGKAHPADGRGKDILASIAREGRSEDLSGKVIFLEDYDADLARYLVQGVDVWLNTPTRLMEASGTSGMKSAANGGLNLSIADGWWPEGADGQNGWTIAGERIYDEQVLQDQHDSVTLYRLLEEEVVPLYFDRDDQGVPRAWLTRARHALATLPAMFDSVRMVDEYARRAYRPLARSHAALVERAYAPAREAARRRARLERGLVALKVHGTAVGELACLRVGEPVEARVELELGELSPDDVLVELVVGHSRGNPQLINEVHVELLPVGSAKDGVIAFEGSQVIERSGEYAYGIRVRAREAEGSGGWKEMVRWL
ncbi:MAG: alpha-glucan family phosphorylase [Planctomycetota bacterium]|nr:alpha-glucan family phosphorylase [Planctomycetota bacterium]